MVVWSERARLCVLQQSFYYMGVCVCEQQGSAVRPINRRSSNRQGEPGCV